MQSFSDVWKDSRSRHVAGRVNEFKQRCLNIAESYIPVEKMDEYRRQVEEERGRSRGVYAWADAEARKMEDHLIFGDPL